jgi:hypothetical protein
VKIGDRVFITDKSHPWVSHAGEVVSGEEVYGLGWRGYRVKIDGTCGQECYVQDGQVMGPARVDKITYTMRRKRKLPE